VVPYLGQPFVPTNKQLEEFHRTKGWLFEDHANPNINEVKWVMRPDQDGQYHIIADVNRGKTFLMDRLATPLEAPGSIALFNAPAEDHELFTIQVCDSEYPEPVSARGITKDMWQVREGVQIDNDYLDCLTGCVLMMTKLGVYLPSQKQMDDPIRKKPRRRSFSDEWKARRQSQ